MIRKTAVQKERQNFQVSKVLPLFFCALLSSNPSWFIKPLFLLHSGVVAYQKLFIKKISLLLSSADATIFVTKNRNNFCPQKIEKNTLARIFTIALSCPNRRICFLKCGLWTNCFSLVDIRCSSRTDLGAYSK